VKTVNDAEWITDLEEYKQELNKQEQKTMNELNQSNFIGALAAALCKVQGALVGAIKDSNNPFFKSKYADLASVWESCRAQLAANNLCVIQTTAEAADGAVLITTLAHSSGEWIRSVLPIKVKDNSPQAQGSGLTYARRYALAAIVGVSQIDDDAEAAQGRAAPKKVSTDLLEQINACKTVDSLTSLYKAISTEERVAATSSFTARRAELEST